MTPVAPRNVNDTSCMCCDFEVAIKLHTDFSWQGQYLVKLDCCFSWHAQYLVKLHSCCTCIFGGKGSIL